MLYTRRRTLAPHIVVIRNIALVFLCLFLVVRVLGLLQAYYAAKRRLADASQSLAEATKQKGQLDREYTDLTTTEGMEYYLRDQYRAVANGEELVVLVDSADDAQKAATASAPHQPSWFQKVLQSIEKTRQ